MNRPVALVTGARRGIGRAIGMALAGAGYDIAFTDIEVDAVADEALKAFQQGGSEALFLRHDVADVASHAALIETVLERFGALHCFVSNAGIGSVLRGDMLDLAPENFDRVIGVNLRGAAFLSQVAAKAILSSGGDLPRSLVFVTSVSADMVSPERADYCVSKAGLSMWAQALAVRLAPEGVPVFEVRPGIIRTAMTAGVAGAYDEKIAAGLVPARRWGVPEDVGRMVAALASGAFGFATGSIVSCDRALSVSRL